MTILQKEIQKRSKVISDMGHWMFMELVNITSENESFLQTGFAAMLEANEKDKAVQEDAFEKWSWLRTLAEE